MLKIYAEPETPHEVLVVVAVAVAGGVAGVVAAAVVGLLPRDGTPGRARSSGRDRDGMQDA